MNRTILSVCYLAVTLAAGAQTFSENFQEGPPASFCIYDQDNLTPNQSMAGLGFKTGKGWISYTLKDTQETFVASMSKYVTSGTSNDWLVTPEIDISSDNVWLEWKAISCSNTSKAGYKVIISDAGSQTENFTETPVFEIEEEESTWITRYIPLKDYNGKSIHIAFVNNSTDKYLLGIDDIKVMVPEQISMISSTTPSSITDTRQFSISGKIQVNYSQAISSFTASYRSGDLVETQEFSDLSILPGEEYEFCFDKKLVSSPGDTIHYSISVNIGNEKHSTSGRTVCYAFATERLSVLEEGTGTWCGFCTAGHVALDYMRETYPDVITIAVHNEDPMTVKTYDSGLYSLGIEGYPIGFINRKYKSQPMGRDMTPANGGWETIYLKSKEELAPADLNISVEYTNNEKNEVRFHTKATFALNLPQARYSLAYIVRECNVRGTTIKYNQSNSYAGSDKIVGGYEKLPASVPANVMVYQDVARSIKPSFKGEIFVNKTVKAGDEFTSDYILTLPGTILNKENLSFIVLLINMDTGEIANARSFEFTDHEHEGLATNMADQALDKSPHVMFYYQGEMLFLTIELENISNLSTEIYDINGKKLFEKITRISQNKHSFALPVNDWEGKILIMKILIDGKVLVRKIIL